MKLQLLILAACLCAASAGIPKKIFKKYAMTKVMESCFGEQFLSDLTEERQAAAEKCRGLPGPRLPPMLLKAPKMKLFSLMGNVTCVMREMKMLDAENQVDTDSIRQRISAMPVPSEQKEDLYQSMEECQAFSTCLTDNVTKKSPLMVRLGQQLAFFKCFKMAKVESCMKRDFRGDVFPTLMMSGLGLHEEDSFRTLMVSAMLEEASKE